ncbi:MAG: hypothetical protein IKP60_10775 [Treponema sp.]|nr:hypothetical protein [Treponema sp.]
MATSTTKKTAEKSTGTKSASTKSTAAAKKTATKSTATKSTGTKSTAAKKITPAKTETKASGSGFNLSGLLTGAVTSAITSKISSGAIGFKDVNGDGKVDLKDIIQTIVSSFQDGKINVSSISSAITQVWNAGFKSGQESK